MATPYAQDLRDRVLAAYDRGMPTQKIAEVFAVSKDAHPPGAVIGSILTACPPTRR